jgi:hypothetical protein
MSYEPTEEELRELDELFGVSWITYDILIYFNVI